MNLFNPHTLVQGRCYNYHYFTGKEDGLQGGLEKYAQGHRARKW